MSVAHPLNASHILEFVFLLLATPGLAEARLFVFAYTSAY